jgi:hypothetical protein
MILRFFLDIVNGQEAQQIIMKLTSTSKNESEHDIAFKKFLDILHRDLFENKKAFTMSSLLDQCCSMLQNLRSAFNLLAARIASAADIELLKTIFD